MLRESPKAGDEEASWRPVFASAMTLQPTAAVFAAVPETEGLPVRVRSPRAQKRTTR